MSALANLSDSAKHAGDALSIGAIIGTLFSFLPQISALLAAVWFLLRIVETLQSIKLNSRKLRDK